MAGGGAAGKAVRLGAMRKCIPLASVGCNGVGTEAVLHSMPADHTLLTHEICVTCNRLAEATFWTCKERQYAGGGGGVLAAQ